MFEQRITSQMAQGADLRALRRARGLTLDALATRLGRSVGWLSQIERDISNPSLDDLRALSRELDAPLSLLLNRGVAGNPEAGVIVRKNARRAIGPHVDGLVAEQLGTDETDEFEVVHSTFEPGSGLTSATKRPTQELGVVVSGKLDLTIAGQAVTVGPGDSFRIRNEDYTWANPYDVPAVGIWVIAPPVY